MSNEIKIPAHIGERLKKHIKDKRIPQANWARAQGIKQRTILSLFKKETMQVKALFTICQVLKYNFIREIADQLPAEFPPHAVNPLEAENVALKKEIERMKIEIEILERVAGVKKGA